MTTIAENQNALVFPPGVGGVNRGHINNTVQGSLEPYIFECHAPNGEKYSIPQGPTIGAVFYKQNAQGNLEGDLNQWGGTFTTDANDDNKLIYTPVESDTNQKGTFTLIVSINGKKAYPLIWTIEADLSVEENVDVPGVINTNTIINTPDEKEIYLGGSANAGMQPLVFPSIFNLGSGNTQYNDYDTFLTALRSYIQSQFADLLMIRVNKEDGILTVIGDGVDDAGLPDRITAVAASVGVSWDDESDTLTATLADGMGAVLNASNTDWQMNIAIGYGDSDDGGTIIDTFRINSGLLYLGSNASEIEWNVGGETWEEPSNWENGGLLMLKQAFSGNVGEVLTIDWVSVAGALGTSNDQRANVSIALVGPTGESTSANTNVELAGIVGPGGEIIEST